ncbi:MAG: CPBP family intramembrane metalloprotease [Alphaproteobacteria bacterium]|nr:CPBP family intramembrane metalloprotease [Alphaproteobacteria bacterium]
MSAFVAALRHELLLVWRQPGILALYVGMAVALGPVGLAGMEWWMGAAESAAGSVGKGRDLPISALDPIPGWIRDGDGLVVVDGPITEDDTLDEGEVYGHAFLDGGRVVFQRPLRVQTANKVQERVEKMVERVATERREGELARVGLDPATIAVEVEATERNAESRHGDLAGRVLPGTLVFLLVVVSLFSAFDTLTKEKEKGTAETLLTLRIPRRMVVWAKFAAVLATTVAVGALWAVSLFLAQAAGLLVLPNLFGDGQVFTLRTTLILVVLSGLLAAQVASVAVAVAAWAPNYRQASIMSTPVMLGLLAPTAITGFQESDLTPLLAMIPVANVSLGSRLWLGGELPLGMGLLALGATAVHAGLAVGASVWWLDNSDPLDKGLDAEARRAMGDFGTDAFALFALSVVCFWFLGLLAQTTHLLGGLAFSQIVIIGGLALLGVGYFGAPMRSTLSLRAPTPRNLALGVVAGFTLPGVGQVAAMFFTLIAPFRRDTLSGMEALLDWPLPLVLLVAAVLPGVCEELLFRGAILGMLRTRTGPVLAVVLSSAMFGLLHLELARIPVTAVIGLVLGTLLVRTGSLWVGAVAHTLNNAVLFSIAAYVDADDLQNPLVVGALVAMALVCIGATAATRPPEPAPR